MTDYSFNFYFYSKSDSTQEPISRINAVSRYHAALIFAGLKRLPLRSFLRLYGVSR